VFMTSKKVILVACISLLLALFFGLDLGRFVTLEQFILQRDEILTYYESNRVLSAAIFFLIYVTATGLSLPVASVLTLAAGAIFGLFWGVLIISFASSIGATFAFLVARTLVKDWVQEKYGRQLTVINRGIEKEGALYLFMLRMVPLFPFFVINLVMGVTPIKTLSFYLVSQAGMLMATIVFVYAGSQLAAIDSVDDILTPELITALVILGVLPLLSKKIVDLMKRRKLFRKYKRPAGYDANLVVIGAGSAGLVASIIASTVNAKVTLIEQDKMGGDCLNRGCVPSKTLIKSARISSYIKRAAEFGLSTDAAGVDFAEVMARIQRVIRTIEPHDSVDRYTGLGVDCIAGHATIVDPYRVKVADRTITARSVVIATGARPFVPPIAGLDQIDYLTSDNIWSLQQLPAELLVLGGGPIGCELAQAFGRLGAKVTIVDMMEALLPREDSEVSVMIRDRFEMEGVDVRLGHQALRFESHDGRGSLVAVHQGQEVTIPFDRVLIAVGRKANSEELGLQELGVELNSNGTVAVNEYLQTSCPNIYACGDVAGPFQFTHMASHQAWYATVNALLGGFWRFQVNYSVVPWATYTDPEVALVGLNESAAREQGISYEVTRFDMAEVDRAVAEGETQGFIKVLTAPRSDHILGATIVANHAGELIGEYVTAMTHGLGLNKIMNTIHIYPTLGEVNKFVASSWKKSHAPKRMLSFAGWLHRWRRGSGTA
jgi:dihydrolipoamide dehydrogenase